MDEIVQVRLFLFYDEAEPTPETNFFLARFSLAASQFVNQDIKDRQIAKSMESSLSPEDKAAKRKDLNDNILPEKLAFLESMISKSGYFFEDITIADLTVYGLCNWIGMGVLDGISGDCITSLPKLKNLVSKLNEHEKVKAYNAEKNPKLPWF